MSASPGRVGRGDAGARGEDRADVGGTEPTEGDGPFERGDQGVVGRGRLEGRRGRRGHLRASVIPAAAAALMNASAAGPRAQNAISAVVLGRTARAGAGRAPP